MQWLRKSFVGVLSLVLFVSLLGAVLAASFVLNLRQPNRVENWLNESRVYDHFVATIIDQSKKTTHDRGDQQAITDLPAPATEAAIKQAAIQAFSPQLIRQSTQTFINSNYAWLEGRTSTPEFAIDLTANKLDFAKRVGEYIRVSSAKLPICTAEELAVVQGRTIDPLAATCRPPTISPEAMGAAATQQLSTSGDFLSNPVLTAKTINPRDDKGGSQPYYEKLDGAPRAYQIGQKLPFILGLLSIVCILAVIFISSTRRRGVRRVSIVLFLAGLILIAGTFASNAIFKRAEGKMFNNADIGQLQKSLLDFAHRVQSHLVAVDLYFGTAFLLVAILIFIYLIRTRQQAPKSTAPSDAYDTYDALPQTPQPQSPSAPTNKPPRPPRLIQ